MEEKRDVLFIQLEKLAAETKKTQRLLSEYLREAYIFYARAQMSMGSLPMESASMFPIVEVELDIKQRSLMGVRVPYVQMQLKPSPLPYGFLDTTSNLDIAIQKLSECLEALFRLAELEASIYRVLDELRRTQQRVNALEYLLIPRYEQLIKTIELTLEEREREEFVRAKKIKAMLERRQRR